MTDNEQAVNAAIVTPADAPDEVAEDGRIEALVGGRRCGPVRALSDGGQTVEAAAGGAEGDEGEGEPHATVSPTVSRIPLILIGLILRLRTGPVVGNARTAC